MNENISLSRSILIMILFFCLYTLAAVLVTDCSGIDDDIERALDNGRLFTKHRLIVWKGILKGDSEPYLVYGIILKDYSEEGVRIIEYFPLIWPERGILGIGMISEEIALINTKEILGESYRRLRWGSMGMKRQLKLCNPTGPIDMFYRCVYRPKKRNTIEHEKGHILLESSSEEVADLYAVSRQPENKFMLYDEVTRYSSFYDLVVKETGCADEMGILNLDDSIISELSEKIAYIKSCDP